MDGLAQEITWPTDSLSGLSARNGSGVAGDATDEDAERTEQPLTSSDLLDVNPLGQFQDHPPAAALQESITGWYLSYLTTPGLRRTWGHALLGWLPLCWRRSRKGGEGDSVARLRLPSSRKRRSQDRSPGQSQLQLKAISLPRATQARTLITGIEEGVEGLVDRVVPGFCLRPNKVNHAARDGRATGEYLPSFDFSEIARI